MRCDAKVLDPERVAALRKMAPTADEASAVRGYLAGGGDEAKLAPPERFLAAVLAVPRLPARLRALAGRHTFAEDLAKARAKCKTLRDASNEAGGSAKLRRLLELVLAVGNHANGGTRRGGAWGFRLGALAKLGQIKSQDGANRTLLQYVASLVAPPPEARLAAVTPLLGWGGEANRGTFAPLKLLDVLASELGSCADAAALDLDQLKADVRALRAAVNGVKRELEAQANSKKKDGQKGKKDDRFAAVFAPCEREASGDLDAAEKALADAEAAFRATAARFGEPPAKAKPAEFFALLVGFGRGLTAAAAALRAEAERKEKARAAEEAKAKRKAMRATFAEVEGAAAAARMRKRAATVATRSPRVAGGSDRRFNRGKRRAPSVPPPARGGGGGLRAAKTESLLLKSSSRAPPPWLRRRSREDSGDQDGGPKAKGRRNSIM